MLQLGHNLIRTKEDIRHEIRLERFKLDKLAPHPLQAVLIRQKIQILQRELARTRR